MDIAINTSDLNINMVQLQKMAFLFNALENGWTIKKKKNCQNASTAVEEKWTETHVLGKIHLPPEPFWTLQKCPKSMTPPSNIAKYVIASPCLNKFSHTFENNFPIFVTGPSQNRPKHIDSIVS